MCTKTFPTLIYEIRCLIVFVLLQKYWVERVIDHRLMLLEWVTEWSIRILRGISVSAVDQCTSCGVAFTI